MNTACLIQEWGTCDLPDVVGLKLPSALANKNLQHHRPLIPDAQELNNLQLHPNHLTCA